VLSRRTVLSRPWLHVREESVRLGNGQQIDDFCVIDAPSWAAVLCVTSTDEVVLVRQYRHGIAAESLELPAGVIERGETPLEAAQRELREETGYVAERWQELVRFATEPSRHTAFAHFYSAVGARLDGPGRLDHGEEIETVTVPRASLMELVEQGGIAHGVHVGAVLLAVRRGVV
jgi:8-oxo-dGTP pyrophosphatase MutT (NUDIX family)